MRFCLHFFIAHTYTSIVKKGFLIMQRYLKIICLTLKIFKSQILLNFWTFVEKLSANLQKCFKT